ncbi:MAG: hypothetical protein U0939_22015 [Pirellulales bacterium]
MIHLNSADLKRFYALARLFLTGVPRRTWPPVAVAANEAGLTYALPTAAGVLEYHVACPQSPASLALPWACWAPLLAGKSTQMRVAAEGESTIVGQWQEGAIPRQARWEVVGGGRGLPVPRAQPLAWRDIDGQFIADLQACCDVTDRESQRYALGCVQFERPGRLAASDGRQILTYSGWDVGVTESKLLPAHPVLSSKEWTTARTLQVATTNEEFALRAGPWTVMLRWQVEGRFPRIDDILADAGAASTHLELDAADREFLAKNLSRLPVRNDAGSQAITVELNGRVAIRGSDGQSPPTELVLRRSRRVGPEVRFATDRRYLSRAIRLGFTRLEIADDVRPVGCRDARRQYVWALLSPEAREESHEATLVIESEPATPTEGEQEVAMSNRVATLGVAATSKTAAKESETPKSEINAASPSPLTCGLELRRLARELVQQAQQLVRQVRSQERVQRQSRRRLRTPRRKASLV